jgi:hypothetical protein
MKRALVLLALAACRNPGSSPDLGAGANPPQLWLALNGSEVRVQLVPSEPPPF